MLYWIWPRIYMGLSMQHSTYVFSQVLASLTCLQSWRSMYSLFLLTEVLCILHLQSGRENLATWPKLYKRAKTWTQQLRTSQLASDPTKKNPATTCMFLSEWENWFYKGKRRRHNNFSFHLCLLWISDLSVSNISYANQHGIYFL